LVDIDGAVIEESLEIMLWALNQNDPAGWLLNDEHASRKLIDENDLNFKKNLDRYKYADRFPEHSKEYYRNVSRGDEEELRLLKNGFIFFFEN